LKNIQIESLIILERSAPLRMARNRRIALETGYRQLDLPGYTWLQTFGY